MISDAVTLERLSRIIGWKLTKGNYQISGKNLPQRIIITGAANTANQPTLDTDPKQITSAKQAGDLYGYGSPIHMMARILLPKSGNGIGGIPLVVHPQVEVGGAAAKVIEITPTGIANGNGTHYLRIAGREGIDGSFYAINIVEGDTIADINAKMSDAINAILECPGTSTEDSYVTTFTSKWKDYTANELTIEIETGDDDLGLTYAVASVQAGSGSPSIANALADIGQDWATILINAYGTNSNIMAALEAYNGIPDPENPTGRYGGTEWKPLIAVTGSVADNPSTITDTRLDDCTIAIAPAPNSPGIHFEAAANMVVLYAVQAQNNPHRDINNQAYPDMPVPTSNTIGSMADYNNRDAYLKKGCSTVDFVAGKYRVQDFVTTYHPVGENPPQYRYCRIINIGMNLRYRYLVLEANTVVDKTICDDNDIVNVTGVIKPKQWKQKLSDEFDVWAKEALIVKPDFSKESLLVGIGESNPDRFETFFRVKYSGITRVSSTTVEAGFNFGSV